jgi:hypothetical protein
MRSAREGSNVNVTASKPKPKPTRTKAAPPPVEVLAARVGDAARMAGVSPRTVWSWVNEGRLRVVRPGPRTTLVLVSSIRALLGE